jgi:hypothetical protein
VALKAFISAWLGNARRTCMRREGTRAPSAAGLSGLCPEPQDIYKRFEEASRITRKGLRKERGLNLSPSNLYGHWHPCLYREGMNSRIHKETQR